MTTARRQLGLVALTLLLVGCALAYWRLQRRGLPRQLDLSLVRRDGTKPKPIDLFALQVDDEPAELVFDDFQLRDLTPGRHRLSLYCDQPGKPLTKPCSVAEVRILDELQTPRPRLELTIGLHPLDELWLRARPHMPPPLPKVWQPSSTPRSLPGIPTVALPQVRGSSAIGTMRLVDSTSEATASARPASRDRS